MPSQSKETREKISRTLKGRKKPYPVSDETRKKLSKALTGKKRGDETRQRISEVKRKAYAEGTLINPWKGTKGVVTWVGKREKRGKAWKGGRRVDKHGYVWILNPGHPNANSSGCVAEHRLVMSNYLNRPLCPWERVHHRNGVKSDNRLENLLLVLSGSHNGEVKCPFCHQEFGVR